MVGIGIILAIIHVGLIGHQCLGTLLIALSFFS